MSRSLVAYFSKTGNTQSIAEAIYETLPAPKEIKPLTEVKDLNAYDLIFIGFPVYSHTVPYVVEMFLKSIPPGKPIALFSTHGSHTGSHLSREALEYAVTLVPRDKILGTFSCRGKVSMEALESFKKSPEHRSWAEMAASAQTHPDENDKEEAKSYAKWVLTVFQQ
ncbi:MAG: flavodoxin [Acidobacteriota bacterium]